MAKEPENTSAAPGGAAAGQTAAIRYVDRPECTETFADSVNHVYFDGQSLRIEFGVTRLDDVKQNAPVTGRRIGTLLQLERQVRALQHHRLHGISSQTCRTRQRPTLKDLSGRANRL